jgi:hypothetical protein
VAVGARRRVALTPLEAIRSTARRMAEAGGASTRAVQRQLLQSARSTTGTCSDELTVLYSNGPDDKSVKLALGYVTAATSGC